MWINNGKLIKKMPKNFKIHDLAKIDRPRLIKRQCAACGVKILVKVYSNNDYIGGHYFGKIPLYIPKSYTYAEYWECDKCYFE